MSPSSRAQPDQRDDLHRLVHDLLVLAELAIHRNVLSNYGHAPMTTYARRHRVSASLAQYLRIAEPPAFLQRELSRDLGLLPLDLVLFVLSFEPADDLSFPFEELERPNTVGELVELVADWLTAREHATRRIDDDDQLGKESGQWPMVSDARADSIRARIA